MDAADANSVIVRLNVGGKIFETSKQTLCKEPDSFLARFCQVDGMQSSVRWGAFFIDRDPRCFRIVLNYLRSYVVDLEDDVSLEAVIAEADFYGLSSLTKRLEERQFTRTDKVFKLLKGTTVVLNDGTKADAGDYLKNKVVALFFSAGWSGLDFASTLRRFYSKVNATKKKLEVVFVSLDREEEDLQKYYDVHHDPWLYIRFGDPKIQELIEKYEVTSIPTLMIVKPNGDVVVEDARRAVEERGVGAGTLLFEDWEALYVS